MKKICLVAFLVVAMIVLVAPLGYSSNNNWGGVDRTRMLNKVFPGYLQAAGTAFGGATSMTSAGVAVPLGYSLVYKAIAAAVDGAQTGTLANGTQGQLLKIYITTVGSSGVWTLTPDTMTGFASLAFNAAGDEATLLYVDDTTGWILIASTSVTVASPY